MGGMTLKRINEAAGTRYTRWHQVERDLDSYAALGASVSEWERTSGPPTEEQPVEQRRAQMADSATWYGWEHYGPKSGWTVESIRLTGMPAYTEDENGGISAEGSIGVNITSEMPRRPQYIERDGYALRIDIESIDWWLTVTSQATGQVVETDWMHQELQGGLAVLHTTRNKDVGAAASALLNGELHKVVAYARPRMRRAKYDGDRRTDDLWSTFASGIGESEPGDTVSESEPYYYQWLESEHAMACWPVSAGEAMPDSVKTWPYKYEEQA